jgi:hypothetical protein
MRAAIMESIVLGVHATEFLIQKPDCALSPVTVVNSKFA